jgi:hypothetical protein
MSYSPRYDRGDWAAVCDSCGRKMKGSELRQRWDGLKVCQDDWEPRQPQDFVRGVADYQAPPWTRPEASNLFIPVTYEYDPYGDPLFGPLFSQTTTSLKTQLITNPIKSPKAINGSLLTLNNTTLG